MAKPDHLLTKDRDHAWRVTASVVAVTFAYETLETRAGDTSCRILFTCWSIEVVSVSECVVVKRALRLAYGIVVVLIGIGATFD